MKKYLILLTIFFVMTASRALLASGGPGKTALSMPDKIGLYLSPSYPEKPLPEMVMTAFAGGGCGQAGELQVIKNLKFNQPDPYAEAGRIDILEILVKGYTFLKASDSADTACPAVVQEARAVIDIAEVMANRPLQLRIILNNQENDFELSYDEGILYLNPLRAAQVISWNPSENMPDKPQHLGYMTREFTDHLAKVSVQGSYAHDSNLGIRLRNYIKEIGYQPLDEKLGWPPMNPLENFVVFIPAKEDVPVDFKIIGDVKFRETMAGEKTIQVGIVKAVLNPFFIRSNQ